ncbi:MAG: ERF family protein [Anaerotignaceae bacterium]
MKQLVEIQNELKAPKSQFNKFGGYKYRNAEDILEAVKPLLFKHKCTLTISDDIVCAGDRIYVKATVIISNGVDSILVSAFAREPEAQKGMSESQITGASSSYARKYALNGMFAIDDTKDSDATNEGKEDDGKPWLNRNTPQFDAAHKYVIDGGKITDIEKKYKLSKEVKEQLNTKP